MKRLSDSSDVSEVRLGILSKTDTNSKKKTRIHSTFVAETKVLPTTSTKELEEREFGVHSGGSMHIVSKKDLNSAELETLRTSRSLTIVMMSSGEVNQRRIDDALPQFFFFQNSLRIMGIHSSGSAVNNISSRMARGLIATLSTMYHFWFLVCQRGLLQLNLDLINFFIGHSIACQEVQRTSEGVRGDPMQEASGTENKNDIFKSEKVQRNISHELPGCLQELRELDWWKCFNRVLVETQSKEVETLPSHLMIFQWGGEQKWKWVRVRTVCKLWYLFEDENNKVFLQKKWKFGD